MKYFVLFAALCTYVLGATLQEHHQVVMEQIINAGAECAEKLGATPEDVDKLMKEQIPDNKAGLCVVACVNKKFGLQNDDGTVNKGSTLVNIEKVKDIDEDMYKKMSSVWSTCNENTGNDSDECNTGINLLKCMKEEGGKLGLTKESMGF
uniref:OBP7 n=2 Tax=Holotrichia parallela TaxID=93412 RepID=F5BYT1_HOLPA